MIAKVFNKNVSEYLQNLGTGKNYLIRPKKHKLLGKIWTSSTTLKLKTYIEQKTFLKSSLN